MPLNEEVSPDQAPSTTPAGLLEVFQHGSHALPGLWRYLLPEDFAWMRLPAEREATCFHCPEVKRGEYRDDCRCCTYFPQIPNFMLGLALQNPKSEAAVLALMDKGHVLPQGMIASPLQLLTAVTAYSNEKFGNLREMVCPFVESGTFHCLVYPFRNSICSTFFCRHDHGETGTDYWNRLQALIGRMESTLAQWAMQEVGFEPQDLVARMDAWADRVDGSFDESGAWSRALREEVWGAWFGKEKSFVERCADVVTNRLSELYDMACIQPYLEALAFERAVRDWIPEAYRSEVPMVADEQGLTEPVASHWYKLQLAHRHLWELPFNEGVVVLAEKARIDDTSWSFGQESRRMTLALDDERAGLTGEEAALLRLFCKPQVLGEALFDRPEIEAVDDARAFLAECMRRGFLVHRPGW